MRCVVPTVTTGPSHPRLVVARMLRQSVRAIYEYQTVLLAIVIRYWADIHTYLYLHIRMRSGRRLSDVSLLVVDCSCSWRRVSWAIVVADWSPRSGCCLCSVRAPRRLVTLVECIVWFSCWAQQRRTINNCCPYGGKDESKCTCLTQKHLHATLSSPVFLI